MAPACGVFCYTTFRMNARTLLLSTVALGFVALCGAATVRYDSASAGGDGSTWTTAYNDLAAAISAVATDGGEVWIKQGAHATPAGGFSLRTGVTVKGGFKGEDGADDATRDIALYATTLTPASGDYLVRQTVDCDSTAILDGCTLTQVRYAYDNTAAYSQPLFRNCLFSGKAGVTVRSGTTAGVDFEGCTFDNLSGGGNYGTINCEKKGPNSFTDCIFMNCVGPGYGLVQNDVTTTFTRCQFLNNRTTASYLITYHPATFESCSFVGNTVTGGVTVAIFAAMRDCVAASNEVVCLSAGAGAQYLFTSQDTQSGTKSRTPVERCSFYDNKVIRAVPTAASGTAYAALVHFAKTGNAIVGSTVERNVCSSTAVSVDVTSVGAIVIHQAENYGGVIASAFVDNDCSTADVVDLGRTSGSDSLIANCLFRRQGAAYVPIKGFDTDTATKGFYVTDSIIQGYDASLFKLIEATNVTAGEPTLYNAEKTAGGHVYHALRTGSDETTAVPDVTVATGGGLYAVVGRYAGWTAAPTGSATTLADPVTGSARTSGAFACGPTDTAVAKSAKLMFRARATPVGSGTITGDAYQDVVPGAAPTAVTAVRVSEAVEFKGWRAVGAAEYLTTSATYAPGALTDDLAVEAVFGVPKIAYTFELGGCGTFDENHQSTLVRQYELGDTPAYPAYTATPNWYLVGWDKALPATVGTDPMTFTMRGTEMLHRIRRYDSHAADGGDGTSWAKAYNSFTNAIADAGQWTGEVWVKAGLHTVDGGADGAALAKNVAIRGGFAGTDGAFANDDAERASRDLAAHYTALQGSGNYVFRQTADADRTATVDSLAFTNTQYAYYSTRANTTPVFSNCWFVGKAGLFANASGVKVDLYDSLIENLSGGNGWGPFHVEYGTVLLSGCRIARTTATQMYGIFDMANSSCVYTNCVFADNASEGNLVNAPNSINDAFYGCTFVGNAISAAYDAYGSSTYLVEGKCFRDCAFVSNRIVRTGTTSGGTLRLLCGTASETEIARCSFFANEMERNQPDLASGSADCALLPVAKWIDNYVNCTFAKNTVRATTGGASARTALLLASGTSAFRLVNCTLVDNVTGTSELADDSRGAAGGSGYECRVVNSLFRNARAGYCPIMTWSGKDATKRGFEVSSSVIPGYDADAFTLTGGNGSVRTDQPHIGFAAWSGTHLYYKPYSESYAGFCVSDGAPETDILGTARPAGKIAPGSCQTYARGGLMLMVK